MVTLNTCHPGKAHRHWYEMVYVLGDDGFGIVIFVPKDADAALIEMLQQYTIQVTRYNCRPLFP